MREELGHAGNDIRECSRCRNRIVGTPVASGTNSIDDAHRNTDGLQPLQVESNYMKGRTGEIDEMAGAYVFGVSGAADENGPPTRLGVDNRDAATPGVSRRRSCGKTPRPPGNTAGN